MLNEKTTAKLIESANAVRENSYSPYSEFQVGAAVLSGSGEIFVGTNVENASYGLTICAERNAIATMVAAGNREIIAIAIVADRPYTPPCGACRQVIYELGKNAVVIMVGDNDPKIVPITELLPLQFEDTGR